MNRLLPFIICLLPTICFSADYNRSDWGNWADLDHDGLNTRQEILQDYTVSGIQCQYTKMVFPPDQIDIDHIIPLKYAWGIGADSWAKAKRVQFYNDPENLVPSFAKVNRSKGAKGPDEWLPDSNVLGYIDRWRHLCNKYQLHCNYELFNQIENQQ